MADLQTDVSVPPAGLLWLSIPSPNLTPQTALAGSVYLRLLRELSASQLLLTLSSTEHCEWQPPSLPTVSATAQKFTVSRVLFRFPSGPFPPGDYSFPFHLSLAALSHSSTALAWGTTQASIKYTVSAAIDGEDAGRIPNVTVNLGVARPVLGESGGEEVGVQVRMKAGCCCDRGEVGLKVRKLQQGYYPGEQVECVVEVNNERGRVDVWGRYTPWCKRLT